MRDITTQFRSPEPGQGSCTPLLLDVYEYEAILSYKRMDGTTDVKDELMSQEVEERQEEKQTETTNDNR